MGAIPRYLGLVALWSINIMSGFFTIINSLGPMAPVKMAQPENWGRVAVIVFVLSSWVLWLIEHKKAASTRPKLIGDFFLINAGFRKGDFIVYVGGEIINHGHKSVVKHFQASIKLSEQEFGGEIIAPPKDETVFWHPTGERTYSTDSYFPRKGMSSPPQRGEGISGFIGFIFRDMKERVEAWGNGQLTVSYRDYVGHGYSVPIPMDLSSLERIPNAEMIWFPAKRAANGLTKAFPLRYSKYVDHPGVEPGRAGCRGRPGDPAWPR